MTPQRIQLSRAKGWRKPENTIVVARPTRWGNRYVPMLEIGTGRWRLIGHVTSSTPRTAVLLAGHEHASRADAIEDAIRLYRIGIERAAEDLDITPDEYLAELRGKNLACWCPLDQPCHADVLLELANQENQ